MSGIYDLYKQISGGLPDDYVAKMHHKIPDVPVFDRAEYLIKATRNKVILDLGASGNMAKKLKAEAKSYYGVDIEPGPTVDAVLDLDKADALPHVEGLQIIVAGEIIEHVSNAGHLLDLMHATGAQVILTTPNAFSDGARHYLGKGIEAVNGQHVAWYSWHTLKVLVERHGFNVLIWGWYNGKPGTAEGLIFHMEPSNGTD